MMELFSEQPRTTKQVADLLGQPPTRLYHHVAALERAGLLVLQEARQNRGAVEKYYAGLTKQYQATDQRRPRSKASRAARRALAATVLDQAKRELLAVPKGSEAPLLARLVIPARPKDIPAIRKRLHEIVQALGTEFARKGESAPGSREHWAVTVALTPASRRT
jgi:DNA-binding transcriptional ArsR family regulator